MNAVAEFKTDVLSCRVKRAAKLYASVYDADAQSIIIPEGTKLTSAKQYISSSLKLAHITEADEKYQDYWIPYSAIQMKTVPVKEEETVSDKDGEIVNVTLIVKGTKAKVYRSATSTASLPTGFKLGDELVGDRRTSAMVGGEIFTRYRIASTTSEDSSVVGMWIDVDYNIKDTSQNFRATKAVTRATSTTVTESNDVDRVTITWYCNNGSPAATTHPIVGTIPTYPTPTKPSTTAGTIITDYGFKGWRGTDGRLYAKRLPEATRDTSYSAEYAVTATRTTEKKATANYIRLPFTVMGADGTTNVEYRKVYVEDYVATGSADVRAVTNYTSPVQLANEPYIMDFYNSYASSYGDMTTSLMNIPIGRMIFVHGMPFQYTHLTDRRNFGTAIEDTNFGQPPGENENDTDKALVYKSYGQGGSENITSADAYGRTFAKEFAFNTPIAVLMPGTPSFLQPVKGGILGVTFTNKKAIDNFLPMFSAAESAMSTAMENLDDMGGSYEYYSMEIDTSNYYKYVNSLCWAAAVFLGIQDMPYHGEKIDGSNYDREGKVRTVNMFSWAKYNTNVEQDFSSFEDAIGLSDGISVAFDPQSSFSSTIQNSTTQSQFESMLNGLSSKANEINFLAGYTGSGLNWIDENADQAASSINVGNMSGLENVASRVMTWARNTSHGMNIRFPELWSDSQHMPSYEMDMHFITPYATPFCIWRYVLVPFYHIFALAAPHSDNNASQYGSPFLIKAYAKGYFNVEMGIIESITWKRFGDGDMMTEGGLPTQIDVSISFKDMYHTLGITDRGDSNLHLSYFINNAGLMEMLGTMSGVNVSRLTIEDRAVLFAMSTKNAFGVIGSDFHNKISDRIRSVLQHVGIRNFSSARR